MDVREKLVEHLRKLSERIKYHLSHEWKPTMELLPQVRLEDGRCMMRKEIRKSPTVKKYKI